MLDNQRITNMKRVWAASLFPKGSIKGSRLKLSCSKIAHGNVVFQHWPSLIATPEDIPERLICCSIKAVGMSAHPIDALMSARDHLKKRHKDARTANRKHRDWLTSINAENCLLSHLNTCTACNTDSEKKSTTTAPKNRTSGAVKNQKHRENAQTAANLLAPRTAKESCAFQ